MFFSDSTFSKEVSKEGWSFKEEYKRRFWKYQNKKYIFMNLVDFHKNTFHIWHLGETKTKVHQWVNMVMVNDLLDVKRND